MIEFAECKPILCESTDIPKVGILVKHDSKLKRITAINGSNYTIQGDEVIPIEGTPLYRYFLLTKNNSIAELAFKDYEKIKSDKDVTAKIITKLIAAEPGDKIHLHKIPLQVLGKVIDFKDNIFAIVKSRIKNNYIVTIQECNYDIMIKREYFVNLSRKNDYKIGYLSY